MWMDVSQGDGKMGQSETWLHYAGQLRRETRRPLFATNNEQQISIVRQKLHIFIAIADPSCVGIGVDGYTRRMSFTE